jgi:hypothetical protein
MYSSAPSRRPGTPLRGARCGSGQLVEGARAGRGVHDLMGLEAYTIGTGIPEPSPPVKAVICRAPRRPQLDYPERLAPAPRRAATRAERDWTTRSD